MDRERIETNVRDSVGTVGVTVAEYAFREPRRLHVIIDSERGVTLEDCRRATRAVEEGLRAAGYEPEDFTIQVESPGVDRKLTSDRDFERFRGREVALTLHSNGNGARYMVGHLGPVGPTSLVLLANGREMEIQRESIKEVRLHLSFGRKHG